VRAYRAIIERFIHEFGDGPVDQVTPEQILTYLNRLTEGNKPYTKRIRYSQLSSFFNFVRNNIDPELINPCDRPMIRKLYRERVPLRWKIIEKETIDEIIFRTTKVRTKAARISAQARSFWHRPPDRFGPKESAVSVPKTWTASG
jgi:integrase/recombinase XerD